MSQGSKESSNYKSNPSKKASKQTPPSGKPTQSSSNKPKTKSKTPDGISKVLDPATGSLNAEERARREKEVVCIYCGGKHSLEACPKKLAKEAAKPKN